MGSGVGEMQAQPATGEAPPTTGSIPKDMAINAFGGLAGTLTGAGATVASAVGANETAQALDDIRKNWQALQDESGGRTILGKAADITGSVLPGLAGGWESNAALFAAPAFRDRLKQELDAGKSYPVALAHAAESFGINMVLPHVATRGSSAVAKAVGADTAKGVNAAAVQGAQAAGEGAAFSAADSVIHKATDAAAGAPNDQPWVDPANMAASALAFTGLRAAHHAPAIAGKVMDHVGSPSQQFGRALGKDVDAAQYAPPDEAAAQAAGVTLNPNLAAIAPLNDRIKRLRDAGEEEAADTLQQRVNTMSADIELPQMADQPFYTPAFEAQYRKLRQDGTKPAEASARAAMLSDFAQKADQMGLPAKSVEQAIEKSGAQPLAKVPRFFDKYASLLHEGGIGQPLPDVNLHDALRATGENAMTAAADTLYPSEKAPVAKAAPAPKPIDTGNDIALTPEAEQAHRAATSPLTEGEPTDAQKAAGNYRVGRIKVAGLDISVENPQGSVRRGTAPDGTPWESPMRDHYGYIRGTVGADKDHLDVFVKPGTPEDFKGPAFVVDQVDPATGKFDEHKVVLGAADKAEAEEVYRRNYGADWKGLAAITELPIGAFKAWAKSDQTKEPLGDISEARPDTPAAAPAEVPAPLRPGAEGDAGAREPSGEAGATVQPNAALTERYGREHVPLSDGGKPFKHRAEADKARKQQQGMRVLTVPTDGGKVGYVLAHQTPAQLAAGAKAAKRLALPNTSPAGEPIHAHGFIAAEGGLSRDAMPELGFDKNVRVGNRPLFAAKGKGMTLAQAAEKLHEAGYIKSEDERDAADTLTRSLKGTPQYTPEGWERIAAAEHATRFEDHLAAHDESDDPFAPLTADEMKETGPLTDHEEREFRAMVDAMEAAGVDTSSILEEAHYLTQNGTQHDYRQQARTLLEAAAASRRETGDGARAEQGRADAQSEGVRRSGEADGKPGSEGVDGKAEVPAERAQPEQVPDGGRAADGAVSGTAAGTGAGGPGAVRNRGRDDGRGDARQTSGQVDQSHGERGDAPDSGKPDGTQPAVTWSSNSSGSLTVKGDPQAIHKVLTDAGVTRFLVAKTGVLVNKAEGAKAEKVLAKAYGKPPKPVGAPAEAKPLSVGMTPNSADAVTVKDGIVHIGKYEAVDFNSGEPIKVPEGATDAQIKKALQDGKAIPQRAHFYGGEKEVTQGTAEGLTSPTREDVLAQQEQRDAEKQRQEDGGDKPAPVKSPTRDQIDLLNPQGGIFDAPADRASEGAQKGDEKITDLGEKIGGARKDTAESGFTRSTKAEKDDRPTWAKRFQISQIVRAAGQINAPREEGRWIIRDNRSLDWNKQPKQVGRDTYATKEEAEAYLPIAAVSLKHRAVGVGDGKYEIWRDVSDRKRVKVVDQQFDSREQAMEYMAKHAAEIVETNTTFGEADLPLPPDRARTGPERRKGDVAGKDFMDAFGFRGVEFGNWNNQQERQALMNDAYDGLKDLADVLGVPPKALGLNGDLALAFGARGQGLNSARAHYELERAVINLTKEQGAGTLAHEWFHAFDAYLGRQDGKASSEWVVKSDGTRALKVSGVEANATHGFKRQDSGVREELRTAYEKMVNTIFKKGVGYVEDAQKADAFAGRAHEDLAKELAKMRSSLAEQKDPSYWKRNNKPASAELLAEFDTIAKRMLDGEVQALSTDWRGVQTSKSKIANRWTNDSLERLNAIYKEVRGRSGFDSTNRSGIMDGLRGFMERYSQRLKMLAEAQTGSEKTKMVPTEFAMNARELDQGRGGDYWTTPHEMAARAFQGYVEDKIDERGGKSRFLNYAPENGGILTPWGVKFPYPRGEERATINKAIDGLVSTIKTRETDDGVAMFSRNRSAMKSPDANEKRGQDSMNKALLEKADVNRAMHRTGLGWVDFVWGDAKEKKGMGLAHILDQRQGRDGMSESEVQRMLIEPIVSTIARGTETRRREFKDAAGEVRSTNVVIGYAGHEAVLVKSRGSNAWMLSAWGPKERSPGATQEGYDTRVASQPAADSTDGKLGAGDDSIVGDYGPSLLQRTGAPGTGMSPTAVRTAIGDVLDRLTIPHTVYATPFAASKATGLEIPSDAKGFYYKGKLNLIASAHADPLSVEATAWHEISHAGTDAIYTAGSKGYEDAMRTLVNQNPNIKAAALAWMEKYGREDRAARIASGATPERAMLRTKLQSVDEALAEMSGRNVKISGIHDFIAKAQEVMRAMGLHKLADWIEGKTDSQALSAILAARRAVMQGGKAGAGNLAPAFKKGLSFSRDDNGAMESRWPDLQEAYDRYESGDDDVRDLHAAAMHLLEDDRAPESIRDAAEKLQTELDDEAEYGGRNDVMGAEDAFTTAVESALNGDTASFSRGSAPDGEAEPRKAFEQPGKVKPSAVGFKGALAGPYRAYAGVEQPKRQSRTTVADSIAKALTPAARDQAGMTAGIIRANLGEQARVREVAQKQLIDFAKTFDKMPVEDNYKFIDDMERGKAQEDPEMTRAAVALRKVLDERRDQVIALGKGQLENFNENYFPHIWKDRVRAATFFSRRPLEGGKGFLKQRTYDYFSEGLNAGLEPVTTNPVELTMLKAREMDRYIYGQRIFQEMKDAGIAKFVAFAAKPPEGWEKINDRIARVMQYSEEAKGMILRGDYYAPEQAATIINNHLSPGLSGIAAFDMLRKAGNMMNAAQLGLSAFHLGFTTLDAMISKAALGIKQVSRGDVLTGGANMVQSLNPLQPLINLYKGDKLFRAYMGDTSDPNMAPLVDALTQAGGRVKMDDVYRNAAVNEFRQAVRKGNWGTAAMKALPRVMDLINKPIFEYLVPRQKLGVFFDMAKDQLAKNPDMSLDEKRAAMGKLWDSVDNRMGELVYDNVFWNRALKDALMVSVRSVGWNLGTFREIGGGVKDLKDIGKIGGLSDRSSYILGLSFVTALLGSMTQYLMTGKGPEELKDVFFPRTGKTRPDGTEDRLSLPSYMKDIAEYGHDIRNFGKYGDNPFNTLENKMHPLLSTLHQIFTNKDFFGGAIRSPGDAPLQQVLDEANYLLKQFTPFGVRNYIQQAKLKDEEPTVLGYLTSPQMIGLTPSPGYITKNDAEAESSQVSKMHDSLMTKFREEMRDGADWSEIRQRARDAGLSGRDLDYLRRSAVQRPPKRLKSFATHE